MKTFETYLLKFLRKANPAFHSAHASWAQQGEDVLIDFIFSQFLNCKQPSYLDIGAHHPWHLSNTYHFYLKGCRGINIEPDPSLMQDLIKYRPDDININAGISASEGVFDFYIMSAPTLNTFSYSAAQESIKKYNGDVYIKEVKKIETISINYVLKKYFTNLDNYFISIDVEGLDFDILQSIDFSICKAPVICVEANGKDESNVLHFLEGVGYNLYSKNQINCIFLKKN
jgi:FkbM family methyltransferase